MNKRLFGLFCGEIWEEKKIQTIKFLTKLNKKGEKEAKKTARKFDLLRTPLRNLQQ